VSNITKQALETLKNQKLTNILDLFFKYIR